jgi:hypothetical protein
VCTLVTSFGSLIFTLMYYNDERFDGDAPAKFCLALPSAVTGVAFRVFVAAVMFSVAPAWSFIVAFIVYLVHLIVFKVGIDSGILIVIVQRNSMGTVTMPLSHVCSLFTSVL